MVRGIYIQRWEEAWGEWHIRPSEPPLCADRDAHGASQDRFILVCLVHPPPQSWSPNLSAMLEWPLPETASPLRVWHLIGLKWARRINLWNSSTWAPALHTTTWTMKRWEEVLCGYLSLKSKHVSTPVGNQQLIPHITSTWNVQARRSIQDMTF